jgi:hypothetical protein
MSAPPLRVLPNPTADAMQALGSTLISGVLGTYDFLLQERRRLFHLALSIETDGDSQTEYGCFIADELERACRRLRLYCELAAEVGN